MIVYSATRPGFSRDVSFNRIAEKILDAFESQLGRSTSPAEVASWENSMQYMNTVLSLGEIPPTPESRSSTRSRSLQGVSTSSSPAPTASNATRR